MIILSKSKPHKCAYKALLNSKYVQVSGQERLNKVGIQEIINPPRRGLMVVFGHYEKGR